LAWLALFLRALLRPCASLALENVALRQQLNVLRRLVSHPRLTDEDRLFWLVVLRLHDGRAGLVQVVSPQIAWRWIGRLSHGPRSPPRPRRVTRAPSSRISTKPRCAAA
jgi:hypothetical protein